MRRDGVAVLLDITDGQLPAITHWGADLGIVSAEDVAALALAGVRTTDGNPVDVSVRQSMLPQQAAGWMGRPGLSGHRTGGMDWSPRFVTTSIVVDGRQVGDGGLGTGSAVVVSAADRTAEVELELQIELCAGGLLRSRASVTNVAEDPYQLDDLVPYRRRRRLGRRTP
jgi:alpha-galactosidase